VFTRAKTKTIFILRITLTTSDYLSEFNSFHFPVKLFRCANGAHGQEVVFELRQKRFFTSTLACSKIGSAKGLHRMAPTGNTPDVYQEVLCRIFAISTYDIYVTRRRGKEVTLFLRNNYSNISNSLR
jgi:hypothetical protein